MKMTLAEALLMDQIRESNRRIVRESRIDRVIPLAHEVRAAQQYALVPHRPPGATEIAFYAADGRYEFRGEWVTKREYQRRLAFHRAHVIPRQSGPQRVTSGLRGNGSVSVVHEEVSIAEYYRRYRKWRYILGHNESLARADFELIDKVTGWKNGFDNWFLRLLGFGPRPRFRKTDA